MRPVKFRRETDIVRFPHSDALLVEPQPRPIQALAKDYRHGTVVEAHRHASAQLLLATSGTMRVTTDDGAWIVPPLRAVWIPPGIRHGWHVTGLVALRTLFIDPSAAPFMPAAHCRVVEVSDLLRALILAAIDIPTVEGAPPVRRAAWIAGLILDELSQAPEVPLRLPLPQDARLRTLCRALLEDPARDDTLEAWAEQAGASGRTLARLFLKETGLTFGAWRQQARLAEAVARLALGQPIAAVARAAGYDSASAFTAMFRRTLGASPRSYLGTSPKPMGDSSDSACIAADPSP